MDGQKVEIIDEDVLEFIRAHFPMVADERGEGVKWTENYITRIPYFVGMFGDVIQTGLDKGLSFDEISLMMVQVSFDNTHLLSELIIKHSNLIVNLPPSVVE